jgi:hypothetical protein
MSELLEYGRMSVCKTKIEKNVVYNSEKQPSSKKIGRHQLIW